MFAREQKVAASLAEVVVKGAPPQSGRLFFFFLRFTGTLLLLGTHPLNNFDFNLHPNVWTLFWTPYTLPFASAKQPHQHPLGVRQPCVAGAESSP